MTDTATTQEFNIDGAEVVRPSELRLNQTYIFIPRFACCSQRSHIATVSARTGRGDTLRVRVKVKGGRAQTRNIKTLGVYTIYRTTERALARKSAPRSAAAASDVSRDLQALTEAYKDMAHRISKVEDQLTKLAATQRKAPKSVAKLSDDALALLALINKVASGQDASA